MFCVVVFFDVGSVSVVAVVVVVVAAAGMFVSSAFNDANLSCRHDG